MKKNSGDLEKSSIKEPSRTAMGNQSTGILRVSPAREANLLMGVGCQTYWVTSELKNCFILQSVYLEVCIENEPVKKIGSWKHGVWIAMGSVHPIKGWTHF